MRRSISLTILTALVSCSGEPDAYHRFTGRLQAGAPCAELIDVRNEIAPKDPRRKQANDSLRGIGCFTVTSIRRSPAAEAAAAVPDTREPTETFTVLQYRVYRAVMDAPMSVSEQEALRAAAEVNGVNATEAAKAVESVQSVLSQNGWFGTPESEVRRASDWSPSMR